MPRMESLFPQPPVLSYLSLAASHAMICITAAILLTASSLGIHWAASPSRTMRRHVPRVFSVTPVNKSQGRRRANLDSIRDSDPLRV